MKVLVVRPMEMPEVQEIDHTLSAMQELVGGTIQAVYPFDDPVALVCNDEGKLLRVQLWYGPMNLEHSDLVAQQEFAQSKESVQQVESWLREQYEIYLKTKGASDYLKKKKKKNQ